MKVFIQRQNYWTSKSGLKLACKGNVVYGDLKSENSQDYAQKPQRNCTFMFQFLETKNQGRALYYF